MAYSGAWLQRNGPYEYVNMQRVHTADPRHGEPSAPDLNTPGYTAPEGTAQTGFGLPVDAWLGGEGVLLEYSPQEHELGIGTTVHPSDPYIGGSGLGGGELTQTQERIPYHEQSYGADLEYNSPPIQWWDERYGTIRSDGTPRTLQDNAPTGWRGTYGNSSPVNNPPVEGWPEGYRLGSDLMVVGVDRKFHIGERFHDRHVVVPNTAEPGTYQTRGQGYSPYLAPFDAARRAITRAWNTPIRTQSPPDYSDDITADSPTESTSVPDWSFV